MCKLKYIVFSTPIIFTTIFTIVTFSYYFVLVDQFCKLWVSSLIMWVFFLASSYNLTAMSIDRHGAITRPFGHDEHKVRRRLPFILVLVYIPVILHLLPIYFSTQHINGVCIVNISSSESFRNALFYVFLVMDLIIPGSLMLFCYVHMALHLKHAREEFDNDVMESNNIGSYLNCAKT